MDAIARVRLTLQDRDHNDGTVQWNIPSTVTFDSVVAALLAEGIPRVMALSDATFMRATVFYTHTANAPAPAPESSSTHRKLMLFVRNINSDLDMISIPSPIAAIFDSSGLYEGIRVNPLAIADMIALLSMLPFRTKDNRLLGSEYITGALAY